MAQSCASFGGILPIRSILRPWTRQTARRSGTENSNFKLRHYPPLDTERNRRSFAIMEHPRGAKAAARLRFGLNTGGQDYLSRDAAGKSKDISDGWRARRAPIRSGQAPRIGEQAVNNGQGHHNGTRPSPHGNGASNAYRRDETGKSRRRACLCGKHHLGPRAWQAEGSGAGQ